MPKLKKTPEIPLYEAVAARIEQMIDSGALAIGSRAPSVRVLAAQLKVSIATVVAAYRVLEDRGRLAARPAIGILWCARFGGKMLPEAADVATARDRLGRKRH